VIQNIINNNNNNNNNKTKERKKGNHKQPSNKVKGFMLQPAKTLIFARDKSCLYFIGEIFFWKLSFNEIWRKKTDDYIIKNRW